MKLYFNDLSCGDASICLAENFDKVIRIFDLLKHLKDIYGHVNIILDRKLGGLSICDIKVAECEYKPDFNFDKRNLIRQLANYINNEAEIDGSHVFLHTSSGKESVLLGNACEYSMCAVSFTFGEEFETHEIKGTKDGRERSILNLYDKDKVKDNREALHPLNFVSRKECKKHDPIQSPLWNVGLTTAYHTTNKDRLDHIKDHPEQKISILSEVADVIAQLNGWELDEGLSKTNKTPDKYRRIYHPAKFSKRNAYISIDFEKPDIYFELHDKKGRHMGEYKWNGEQSGPADNTGLHNIIVR